MSDENMQPKRVINKLMKISVMFCHIVPYATAKYAIFNYETGTMFSFTALCIMVSKFLGSTTTLMKFMGTGSSFSP